MAIKAVERLRYEEMVMDILNKIFITGKRGVLWVVEALEYMVIRNKKVPKRDHIPTAIYHRAKQLRELLKDKEMYAREEDIPEYVSIVKDTVRSKIKALLFMSKRDIKKQIQIDRNKLAESKKPKESVSHLREHQVSVETTEEVAVKDQWRVNLMYPMDDEQGLYPEEMASLCNLIDNEKYHWPYAMLLTANISLAHWIASPEISELILKDVLDMNNNEHLGIMTEPTPYEMRRLTLLSPILKHEFMTVKHAVSLELSHQEIRTLNNPALRARLQTLPFSDEDDELLSSMGIFQDDEVQSVYDDIEDEEDPSDDEEKSPVLNRRSLK
jgi:hypothetical protein